MTSLRWNGTPIPNAWTPDDVAALRALAGKHPTTEVAVRLGRTRHAIIDKAQKLGISLAVHTPALHAHRQPWLPDDIRLLRRLARTHTIPQTAAILGRGVHGVVSKAQQERIAFRKSGERHASAKYPTETIRRIWEIRQRTGWGPDRIAREVGIPRGYICNIVYYRWRYREMMAFDAQEGNAHD